MKFAILFGERVVLCNFLPAARATSGRRSAECVAELRGQSGREDEEVFLPYIGTYINLGSSISGRPETGNQKPFKRVSGALRFDFGPCFAVHDVTGGAPSSVPGARVRQKLVLFSFPKRLR